MYSEECSCINRKHLLKFPTKRDENKFLQNNFCMKDYFKNKVDESKVYRVMYTYDVIESQTTSTEIVTIYQENVEE